MAKFIYKMQNILEIKLKLEEQAKSAYGIAKNHLDEEERKLELLEQKKLEYQEDLTELMQETLQVTDICRAENAVEITKYKINVQKVEVKKAQLKVENARKALQDAMVERKIQEKLRENEFEKFKIELNAQEQKEVDELVSYKYGAAAIAEEV